ncbi:DNA photolyase [Gracilaria domingensis]|nr:DNA photolyase [Gracilaria domingensis]
MRGASRRVAPVIAPAAHLITHIRCKSLHRAPRLPFSPSRTSPSNPHSRRRVSLNRSSLRMSPPSTAGFVGSTPAARARVSVPGTARTPLPNSLPALASVRAAAVSAAPNVSTRLVPMPNAAGFFDDGALGKGMDKVVVLFRSDLRLDDHPALSYALEDAKDVVPVYCFDPRHFGRTDYGFQKTGKYRARFLTESVHDLRKSLRAKGSDLIVRVGRPEQVVPDLCRSLNCRHVFAHKEVTHDEQQVEVALEEALKKNGAQLSTFWANTLYHEDDLPFPIERIPDVYSDFREAVQKSGTIRTPLPTPDSFPSLPNGVKAGDIPTLRQLGIEDAPLSSRSESYKASPEGISCVTGGETEAMLRVQAYVDESKRFDASLSPRSQVTSHLGADFSCRISPWLALGCISPRRIFDEMKKASPRPDTLVTSTTYYELVWRDFFRYITAKYSGKRNAAAARSANVSPRVAMRT